MVKLLSEAAPAKINLFLRVVGRRPDGYHELDSVFVPLSLCDRVSLEIRTAADASVALRCGCDGIPVGEHNLAWRAADSFMREFGCGARVFVDLHKGIPAGAGLGGGSSDAAAVLRMMAALWHIEEPARLARVGLSLGADVPFFLKPQSSHVSGIGERIVPFKLSARLPMIVAVPAVSVSTAEIFRALRPDQWSGPAPREHLRALAAGEFAPEMLQNDLAAVAMARYPEIARLKYALDAVGALAASMSGSGGAVFGIFAGADQAARAIAGAKSLSPADTKFFLVNSVG